MLSEVDRLRSALECAKVAFEDIEQRVFTCEEKPRAASYEECRKLRADAMCAAADIQFALDDGTGDEPL